MAIWIAALLSLLFLTPAHDDEATVRAALAARMERLNSIAVFFNEEEKSVERPPATEEMIAVGFRPSRKPPRRHGLMLHHDGGVRFEWHVADDLRPAVENDTLDGPVDAIHVHTPELAHHLLRRRPSHPFGGAIYDPTPLSPKIIPDLGLGMRLATDYWKTISSKVIDEMRMEFHPESGEVVCTYIGDGGETHRWTFDTNDYSMKRYSLQSRESDFETLIITNEDFSNINGIMLPSKMHQLRFIKRDGELMKTQDITVTIDRYEFRDAVIAELLPMRWPEGARVVDARTRDKYVADADGNLELVYSPQQERDESDHVEESSDAADDDGDGSQSDRQSLIEIAPVDDPGGTLRPVIAIIIGIVAGVAGLLLLPRRKSTAAATVTLALTASVAASTMLTAPAFADPPQRPSRAERIARYADFDRGAAAGVTARLARDLTLNDVQTDLVREFVAEYLTRYRETMQTRLDVFYEWTEGYWEERMKSQPHADRYFRESGPDGAYATIIETEDGELRQVSLKDDHYQRARLKLLSDHEIDFVQPQFRAIQAQLLAQIEAVLVESQLEGLDRATRRLDISLNDGLSPRKGGRPTWDMDMLGLVDEACAEGAELHPLTLADHAGVLTSVMIPFEISYLAALESHDKQWERTFEYRSEGIMRDEPKGADVEDDWSRVFRRVWDVRFQLAREVQGIAAAHIGDEAAARWERRFFERCCPWLFEPDRVDAIAEQLGAMELSEQANEAIDRAVAAYMQERRPSRIRGTKLLIAARGSGVEDYPDAERDFHEWLAERAEREESGVATLKTIVETHAPSAAPQIEWEPADPDRRRGG